MLHGFTQSGPTFYDKTRALEKNLRKAFPGHAYTLSLHYPTGPCIVHPADIPNSIAISEQERNSSIVGSFGWFLRKGAAEPYVYDGFDQGLSTIADFLRRHGPFDGVVGFSQGGFMAAVVASLLEEERRAAFNHWGDAGGMPFPSAFLLGEGEQSVYEGVDLRGDGVFHPPLKFAVSYSGFGATPNILYAPFFTPKIKTPMLHFMGSVDTVVEETRSMRLVHSCEAGIDTELGAQRIVHHPGGHFVPASQKQCLIPLVNFIRESMGWKTEHVGPRPKADVDLPF